MVKLYVDLALRRIYFQHDATEVNIQIKLLRYLIDERKRYFLHLYFTG